MTEAVKGRMVCPLTQEAIFFVLVNLDYFYPVSNFPFGEKLVGRQLQGILDEANVVDDFQAGIGCSSG